MNSYFLIYFLTRVDAISTLFGLLIPFFAVIVIFPFLYHFIVSKGDFDLPEYIDDKDDYGNKARAHKKLKKMRRWSIPCFIFFVLIQIALPSKTDLIYILAGGKTLDFVKTDKSIQEIPGNTTEIVNNVLKLSVKELEEKIGQQKDTTSKK